MDARRGNTVTPHSRRGPLTGEPSASRPPIPFPPGQAPQPHHRGGFILLLAGEPSAPRPPITFPPGQAPPLHHRGGFILPLAGEPSAPRPPIPFPPGQAPPLHHRGGFILPLAGEPSAPRPPIPFPPGQAPPLHHRGGFILPLAGEPSAPRPPIPFPPEQAPPLHHRGGFILPLAGEPSGPHPPMPFPPGQAPSAYNPAVGRMVHVIPTFSPSQLRFALPNYFPANPYLNPEASSSRPVGFVPSNVVFMGQDPRIRPVCNFRAVAPPVDYSGRPEHVAGNRNCGNDQKMTWNRCKTDNTFGNRKQSRGGRGNKSYRCDSKGHNITDNQTVRNLKMKTLCRCDINKFDAPFVQVFDSLIPVEDRKIKQKQLLSKLEKIVAKEWPQARLYTYGSCDNTFSFSNSDVDISLEMENYKDIDKGQIVLELANILKLEKYENVKPIPNARIPVLKFTDPITRIPCDICINNAMAVVNTKLLRDYAQIDVRLRQLAFVVKHWAKSRRINETYRGTLSSYAYVLMCINFLQQRNPAILPCLQKMETTYSKTVDNIECSYFDQVETLRGFGVKNEESIAQLVWGFFHYWAYCHDYENDVISVRTGGTLSKSSKGWNTRIGKDGHFISIEDPFAVSHDLSRVVNENSIRVLREEFEHAADIMQHDSSPSVTLFEAYVPN